MRTSNVWLYPLMVFSVVFVLAGCRLLLEETSRANRYEASYEALRADNEAFRRTVGKGVNNAFVCKPKRELAIIEEGVTK